MKRILTVTGLTLFLGACVLLPKHATPQKIALISPDRKAIEVTVEVADTPEKQDLGLMKRTTLDKDSGMLFVFRDPGILTFWMKDTLIPLDIVFFDGQGNYLSSTTMTPCAADPCPYYGSVKPSQLALEVNAGFVKANKIGEGWRIALPAGN